MLRFEPSELEDKYKHALERLRRKLNLDPPDFLEDAFDLTDKDFKHEDYDDITIRPDSSLTLSLPYVEHYLDITYEDFIKLVDEIETAEYSRNVECWTSNRFLIRVKVEFDPSYEIIQMLWNKTTGRTLTHFFSTDAKVNGGQIYCSLANGITVFGFLVVAYGDYDKWFPPVIGEEFFVEIKYDQKPSEEVVRNIVWAYLFELSSSLSVNLEISPRSLIDTDDWMEAPENVNDRLRPLMLGKGMSEVLHLYNKAVTAGDPEVATIYVLKVFEFVSQTMLHLEKTEVLKRKLQSRNALDPDAEFILELEEIFNQQRIYTKERESIILTFNTCCDATELVKLAPPFLKKLQYISASSKRKECKEALTDIAASLVATRNSIAHAKANYTPTGEECPSDQLPDFVECCLVAAQQAIRWYFTRHETVRIL